MKNYIDELLDKVESIIACGAGRPVEIARFVLPEASVEGASVQVNRWIKRVTKPNGEAALRIRDWAAVKTLEIDAAGADLAEAYRKAFAKTKTGKAQKKGGA